MLVHGAGAMVNPSSGAGGKGQAACTATKHGLIGLTKSAALDFAAPGFASIARPGNIDAEMMGRVTGGTDEGRAAVTPVSSRSAASRAREAL